MDKKLFYNSVATTGLLVGVALALTIFISYYMRYSDYNSIVSNVLTMLAMFGITYYRGSNLAKELEEFKYFSAFRYIILSLGLSGILYGIALFIVYNYIAPDYYINEAITVLQQVESSQEAIDKTVVAYNEYVKNPMFMVGTSMFSMMFMGIFPALVVASLIKKSSPLHRTTREDREIDNSNDNNKDE